MINNSMNLNKSKTTNQTNSQKKPNELGTLQFATHLKIFDPQTKQVLVNKRGEN
jgi:hypothetical protein